MNQQVDGRLWAAGGALAVAVLLFGTTLVGAMSEPAVTPLPAKPKTVNTETSIPAPEVITMQAVNEAVAVDPFSPEREPAAEPYRLPTDPEDAPPPPPPPAPPPLPAFRLVGTMQTGTSAVALIQLDNALPKVVAVGESMNGFVLEKVDPAAATMVQGERRIDLKLQQPLARVTGPQRRPAPGAAGRSGRVGGSNIDPAVQQKLMMQELQNMARERAVQVQGGRMMIDLPPVRVRPDTMLERSPRFDR
jgi:hypothetical protein